MMQKIFLSLLAALAALAAAAGEIILAEDGKTGYSIAVADPERPVDRFAARELAEHLREITGAEFPIVDGDCAGPKIRVGGNHDAYASEEYRIVTDGDDLILEGGGANGALYAVYSFLEDDLGCRWFTVRGEKFVPTLERCAIPPIDRRNKPVFISRHHTNYYFPPLDETPYYFARNKFNVYVRLPPPVWEEYPFNGPFVHSLFTFMPPGDKPEPFYGYQPWPEHLNLFETNPEFYSMDGAGNRVRTLQLCFANRAMRDMFTQHLLDRLAATGGTGVLDISASDSAGPFCYCPECRKLEERYGCPGGPYWDYCIEAAKAVGAAYPKAWVNTLAYRKEQSEKPPVGAIFPDNLIVTIAPIDDDFSKPFESQANAGTLEHLKAWRKLTPNIRIWHYPNPYMEPVPMANVERLVRDLKLLRSMDIRGAVFEHDVWISQALNFSDLQSWLMAKLFDQPDLDPEALIAEFADFYYGPAAPEVLTYMRELDALTLASPVPYSWRVSQGAIDYLTPENLIRWQNGFDRLLADEALQREELPFKRAKILRVSLDAATLLRYPEIRRSGLTLSCSLEELIERLYEGKALASDYASGGLTPYTREQFEAAYQVPLLLARQRLKPLPSQFDGIPAERIHQFLPTRNLRDDPEAAGGMSSSHECDELPLTLGTYDLIAKNYIIHPAITREAIVPEVFHWYPLGRSRISPECWVFISRGWFATFPLERAYELGNQEKTFEVWVSLKFEGPVYGGSGETNLVSCDRVVLVE